MNKYIKLLFATACLVLLGLSVVQAADPKKTNDRGTTWGVIVEGHCDARFWCYSDTVNNFGCPTMRYFVLGIGKHTVRCTIWWEIQLEDKTWGNTSYTVNDNISIVPFKLISRINMDWRIKDFVNGSWIVRLYIDGQQYDYETCSAHI
jgi:hypothetical protein